MTDRSVWLFGYGSLVDRSSFEHTLGRGLIPGVDFHEAELPGYQRRWAFSIRSVPGPAVEPVADVPEPDEWTITVLGLVESPGQAVNGVIGRVSVSELAAFDERERTYERVGVAPLVGGAAWNEPVITYLPTSVPSERYERSAAVGSAVVDARYWHLVDRAFAGLGDAQVGRYRATTPHPEVPIVSVDLQHVPPSHLTGGL